MRRFHVAILFAVLAPALGLGRAGKQSWENLNQLRVGQKIEVLDMNSSRSLNGTFLGFSEEAISLRVGGGEVAVPRANVLRIRLRQPRRSRNAAIGAAIGIGVGLAIAIPLSAVEGATAAPAILALVIGGGAGAGAGAASPLGSRTIYKAKKGRRAKAR